MLTGEKILVTGAAGKVAFPIARRLAEENEVWGAARFSNPADREKLKAAGIKPFQKDIGASIDDLPDDFNYVFHAAAALSKDEHLGWQYAFEVNAQATGRLMYHCRKAKGFVQCSTGFVYHYQPQKPLKETDIPGIWHRNTYSLSKIASEGVATWVSSQYGIPTTIIRICSTYGPEGGAPADRLDMLMQGKEIPLHLDKPNHFNPVYEDDYVMLGIRAMEAARVPPLVVNWAGSETVSAEEYCEYLGKLVGKKPKFLYTPEAYPPLWPDVTLMHQELGKCKVSWKDGMRRVVQAKYPDLKLPD